MHFAVSAAQITAAVPGRWYNGTRTLGQRPSWPVLPPTSRMQWAITAGQRLPAESGRPGLPLRAMRDTVEFWCNLITQTIPADR